ncbi:hypothetical protein SCR18_13950, partial [Legionella pneumophila serogroup 1]
LIIKDVVKIPYCNRMILSQGMLKTNSLFSDTQGAQVLSHDFRNQSKEKCPHIQYLPLPKGSSQTIFNQA